MARFDRPFGKLHEQDTFGPREPGLTHPDTKGFIRLRDNGDLELIVSEGLGMVFNARNRSVTIIADEIKLLTSQGDAIRWNNHRFNSQASLFTQPALVPLEESDQVGIYDGADEFYEDSEYTEDA